MQSLQKFGDWLKEGAKFPWGKFAERGIEAVEATSDLSEIWLESAPKIAKLENLNRLSSFFKAFESPVGKLALAELPFASVGIELLRLYWEVTKEKPVLERSLVIAMQMAYLQSLQTAVVNLEETLLARLEAVKLCEVFERQLEKAGSGRDFFCRGHQYAERFFKL